MTIPPLARLELNPDAIRRTIDAAVTASTEVVNFHLNALAIADLSQPATPAPTTRISFQFGDPNLTADQRRAMHESWILARAFHELLRAVRHGLEVAHVMTTLMNTTHSVSSGMTVAHFLKPFETKAQDKNFPDLLADVNKRLATKLNFADSYMSLQAARNCLEHRAGIVGERDTKGKDSFEFGVPRAKLFYMRGNVEVELAIGETIDPGEGQDGAQVLMKFEVRTRTLKLGERLMFTLDEFNEVAFACHQFGAQLVANLPKPDAVG
jgi:hypothetical protein